MTMMATKGSTLMYSNNETQVRIDSNHTEMVKFDGETDPGYMQVSYHAKEVVVKIVTTRGT